MPQTLEATPAAVFDQPGAHAARGTARRELAVAVRHFFVVFIFVVADLFFVRDLFVGIRRLPLQRLELLESADHRAVDDQPAAGFHPVLEALAARACSSVQFQLDSKITESSGGVVKTRSQVASAPSSSLRSMAA